MDEDRDITDVEREFFQILVEGNWELKDCFPEDDFDLENLYPIEEIIIKTEEED